MTDRRTDSSAIARLAEATREWSQRIEAGEGVAEDLLAAFRRAAGNAIDDGNAANNANAASDLGLAVASLAVVLEYWEITSRPHVDAAVEFATRDPACEILAEVVVQLNANACGGHVVIAAARDLASAMATEQHMEHDPLLGFVEYLLAAFDANRRRELGVYFTPLEAVNFLVEKSDRVLREQFDCPRGLADDWLGNDLKLPLTILDPAMGTGAFLLSAIRRMRATVQSHWSQFVSDSLLPRLTGCEILPAPFGVANFLVAMELVAGGYSPRPDDRLRLSLGDCLAKPTETSVHPVVVLGNPPYRGSSSNEHEWAKHLLHGQAPDGSQVVSYFHVGGKKLGERKTWLHDDYVKFFRYAQWQVEQSGAGIVAFLTNHGFLDNPTFRGMRGGLLETFDHIDVVDLHGNVKKSKGNEDQSIFETAQGMAMTVAWRNGGSSSPAIIERGDLRGPRSDKLARLNAASEQAIAMSRIAAVPPYYFFHADSSENHPEYDAGFRLPDIMPVNTTAAVTARDWFVVDIHREALVSRLREFADLSISDEVIRERYFQRTRSTKYPPGDTRGWKLASARRRMASETDWQRHIRRCWYRPFDRRWTFWVPWMIDWPRADVMRHMQHGNPALVCRRQSVCGQPCNFFWIADGIVLDGYIRSDNRGSESIFPLFLFGEGSAEQPTDLNLSPEFIGACERQLGWTFESSSTCVNGQLPQPLDLLHYAYALFHSPTYRTRYAVRLSVDFPHVLIPHSASLFRKLSQLGLQLVAAHLGKSAAHLSKSVSHLGKDAAHLDKSAAHLGEGEADSEYEVRFTGSSPLFVGPGYPKYSNDNRVVIGGESRFHPVPVAAWEFRVGAHQVLRKWLKDRRRRTLSDNDVRTYLGVVQSVLLTQRIMRDVDDAIMQAGGWPAAFLSGPTQRG